MVRIEGRLNAFMSVKPHNSPSNPAIAMIEILGFHMFMDRMNIPLDAKDKLDAGISMLMHADTHNVSLDIEHHRQSQRSEWLGYSLAW